MTVRAEKDKWPAIGEAVSKKSKQKRAKQGKILYFFGYKAEILSSQNNPKNLDQSYKTDLDIWDCLGRVKLVLSQYFIGLK